MFLGVLTALFAGLFTAGFGVAVSYFARGGMDMFRFLFWNAFFTALICFAVFTDWGVIVTGEVSHLPALLWWITGGGICSISGSLCVQHAMKRGHNNIIWAIQQSSLILPFFTGVIFFAQRYSIFQLGGVALIIGGIIYPIRWADKQESSRSALSSWLPFAIIAFLLVGSAQAMQNVPSYWHNWQDAANLRPALAYMGGSLGSFCAALLLRRKLLPLPRKLFFASGGIALLNILIVMTMFKALDLCSAANQGSIGYPVIVGSSIIFFALYSLFVMKERNTVHHWLGLAGILAGIITITIIPNSNL